MIRIPRKYLARALTILAATVAVISPVIATSYPWRWNDVSSVLPYRGNLAISIVSENHGQWLVSDGQHLYRYNGGVLRDLTSQAHSQGINAISDIIADGRQWLVLDQSNPNQIRATLTDGQSWNDISAKLTVTATKFRVTGHDGVWYFQADQAGGQNLPGYFDLYQLNGTNSLLSGIALPATVSNHAVGCSPYLDSNDICSGVNTPVMVNDQAFFIGGTSEMHTPNGSITQAAVGGVWRLDANGLSPMSQVPSFKFVSGVWPSHGPALIATSNDPRRPLAMDHLWLFDGNKFTDLSDLANANHLLATDVSRLKAAWDGQSWLILNGKHVVRFDGSRMHDEGRTRDLFQSVSGSQDVGFVLGGAVSRMSQDDATNPLTAKLVAIQENHNARPLPWSIISDTADNLLSSIYGPSISLNNDPVDAKIGNGSIFVFKANANDPSGIDRIDIYALGSLIKSCNDSNCSYIQNYWTNGQGARRIELFARAFNKRGYHTDSQPVSLLIAEGLDASGHPTATLPAPAPQNQTWLRDAATDISWTSWLNPDNGHLTAGQIAIYSVEANSTNGIEQVDIWVNGNVKQSCDFHGLQQTEPCSVNLSGDDYSAGSDVFINANIRDHKMKNAWTAGATLHRDATAAVVRPPTVAVPNPSGAVFRTKATLTPDITEVTRGTIMNFHTVSYNNTLGLGRVEILVNGKVERSCNYPDVHSDVSCDIEVDTAKYMVGTSVNLLGHVLDNYGNEIWSNAKTIVIREPGTIIAPISPAPTDPNGMSTWSWLSPQSVDLYEGQSATYNVGSWSPNGIKKIDILVDGTVRHSCDGAGSGSRECSYTFTAYDFAHGHVATVNARAIDNNSVTQWTQPNSMTIHRGWDPINVPGPYVSIQTDHPQGYNPGDAIVFHARGWAPRGVDRLEIYLNGSRVMSCPTDNCNWTSPVISTNFVDYQARIIDTVGQDTWTGLYGLNKKQ